MSYNKTKALDDKVRAIETALCVQRQGRQATDREKETLSRYTGFGGVKEVLNIGTEKPTPCELAVPMARLQEALLELADGDTQRYKALVENVKSSVLTAFYTPQFLIAAVERQIQATLTSGEMKMRTFLEPSAGIGGFLPVAMTDTKRYAFEKDEVMGLSSHSCIVTPP